MLISHLIVRHKTPGPRFAPALFMVLLVGFTLLGFMKPIFGLTGLGTTMILAGSLVIVNRQRIWDNYRKGYRKSKSLKGFWTQPNSVYYNLNIAFLWPFIVFLGLVCLWTSYMLSYN